MKAYTYLVKNKLTGKWYYGVRYKQNCKLTDLFTTYFTSSSDVKNDITVYGLAAFDYEIRKTFTTVERALSWECKVLRRMNVRTNELSYNKHYNKGFTTRFGDDNSSKRLDVRKKLSDNAKTREYSRERIEKRSKTLITNHILHAFRTDDFPIQRNLLVKYNKWIDFMVTHKPNCIHLIAHIRQVIQQISEITNKPYPSSRKPPVFLTQSDKRSASKKGYMWYTSPDRTEAKQFFDTSLVPNDWIPGLKTTQKIEKNRLASSNRTHTEQSKEKMREKAKQKIYYTSPDLLTLIVVYDILDAPAGWIKGNKLKSRLNKRLGKK